MLVSVTLRSNIILIVYSLYTIVTLLVGHLLEKGDKWQAIDLYRRAGKHTEAARHLYSIATDVAKTGQHPLRAKKLYVLAAMQMDALKRKADDAIMAGQGAATQVGNSSFQSTAATLDGFMEQDNALSSDRDLENAWRAAEAFHFLLLAQRQLYSGAAKARDAGANLGKPSQFFVPAAITSIRLMEYEGILDPAEVHSVMALCCYYAEMYKECSR
jgi:WD repeat-containing protein 35